VFSLIREMFGRGGNRWNTMAMLDRYWILT